MCLSVTQSLSSQVRLCALHLEQPARSLCVCGHIVSSRQRLANNGSSTSTTRSRVGCTRQCQRWAGRGCSVVCTPLHAVPVTCIVCIVAWWWGWRGGHRVGSSTRMLPSRHGGHAVTRSSTRASARMPFNMCVVHHSLRSLCPVSLVSFAAIFTLAECAPLPSL